MADFVKGFFGAQKPVAAPVDDGGAYTLRRNAHPPQHHATLADRLRRLR
jgi:hypothetical protein